SFLCSPRNDCPHRSDLIRDRSGGGGWLVGGGGGWLAGGGGWLAGGGGWLAGGGGGWLAGGGGWLAGGGARQSFFLWPYWPHWKHPGKIRNMLVYVLGGPTDHLSA